MDVHARDFSSSSLKSDISEEGKFLPDGFQPGPYDVICARGRKAKEHQGNIRYKRILENAINDYNAAGTKTHKSLIVSRILEQIQSPSSNAIFVRQSKCGRWCQVGDSVAREKIGQSLRDRLHAKYKSSTRSKRLRKKIAARVESNSSSTEKCAMLKKEDPSVDSQFPLTHYHDYSFHPLDLARVQGESFKPMKTIEHQPFTFMTGALSEGPRESILGVYEPSFYTSPFQVPLSYQSHQDALRYVDSIGANIKAYPMEPDDTGSYFPVQQAADQQLSSHQHPTDYEDGNKEFVRAFTETNLWQPIEENGFD